MLELILYNDFREMTQNDLSNKSCTSPWFIPSSICSSDHMVMRQAEYIGSFPVEGLKPKQQVEMIGQQLESMRVSKLY